MPNWGEKIGQALRDIGVGVSVTPLPVQDPQEIINSSWVRGLITDDSPEDIPRQAMADSSDVRVTRNDALIRLEGITLAEDVTPRLTQYLFEQAGLDFSTELIIIDPPYLGYKGAGNFTFVNLGIAVSSDRGWNHANVAGVLIFSNGTSATYTRDPGAAIVTDISADIIAETFAVQFGRVFAGATTDPISGLQGLMIQWNGTGATPTTDWSSANAGRELLLADDTEADRIIALRAVGFDALAILTRKAIWIGEQTNVDNHPANFKLRFPGRGCVAEPTAIVTPHGVAYLSDEGVVLFDLNNAVIISTEINATLLPLDYLQLQRYRMVYQPYRDRLVMSTPTGTWYYEFPKGGAGTDGKPGLWYFSSMIPDSLAIFVDQSGNIFWNTVMGTWNDIALTWAEMVQGELNAPALLYFGKGTKYGYEDQTAFDYMGTAQNPYAVTPQDLQHPSDQISTIWFEVEYSSSAACSIDFVLTDNTGALTQTISKTLPSTNSVKKLAVFGCEKTGMGTTLKLKYTDNRASIFRIRRMFLPAGPAQSVTL